MDIRRIEIDKENGIARDIGVNLDWERNERDRGEYKRDRLRFAEGDWKRYM